MGSAGTLVKGMKARLGGSAGKRKPRRSGALCLSIHLHENEALERSDSVCIVHVIHEKERPCLLNNLLFSVETLKEPEIVRFIDDVVTEEYQLVDVANMGDVDEE